MDVPSLTLIGLYCLALVALSFGRRSSTRTDYLLAGRTLTLPAFVATLVTTWYGGIMAIGEYTFLHGISTWLVFGLPYYAAAILFAFVLAPRLRASGAHSIPDLLRAAYGPGVGVAGAAGVFVQTAPVAYALMLGTLVAGITGWSLPLSLVLGVAFTAAYVSFSGFAAVVRTDELQLVLMYGGFLVLLPAALAAAGGLGAVWAALPASHRSWDGGVGWQTVLVWYLIALQTMVEPAFYQRVFAARTPRTARLGVLVSVVLWAVFDCLTTLSGLAARALLPELANPVDAFPALARLVLSPWLAALFTVGLVAIVMSTLDSYLFIAAATVGHDLRPRPDRPDLERQRTRYGLVLAAVVAAAGAVVFDSAIAVWHHVGSVVTAALLLPVLAVHVPAAWRYSSAAAVVAMAGAAATACAWIAASGAEGYPLGVEPLFPALGVTVAVWIGDQLWRRVGKPHTGAAV